MGVLQYKDHKVKDIEKKSLIFTIHYSMILFAKLNPTSHLINLLLFYCNLSYHQPFVYFLRYPEYHTFAGTWTDGALKNVSL